jgi:protein-L-isoaspartate(D-aspartate) O-methyltransferase
VLVAPVGAAGAQSLLRLRKDADGHVVQDTLAAVAFVPLLSGLVD